jgi:hypothetical protein
LAGTVDARAVKSKVFAVPVLAAPRRLVPGFGPRCIACGSRLANAGTLGPSGLHSASLTAVVCVAWFRSASARGGSCSKRPLAHCMKAG